MFLNSQKENMSLKSISKVCADESTVASSYTCNDRFSSDFLEMKASILQIFFSKSREDGKNQKQNEEHTKMKRLNRYRIESL